MMMYGLANPKLKKKHTLTPAIFIIRALFNDAVPNVILLFPKMMTICVAEMRGQCYIAVMF